MTSGSIFVQMPEGHTEKEKCLNEERRLNVKFLKRSDAL